MPRPTRTDGPVVLEDGHKRIVKKKYGRPEDWEACLLDHHDGYVTWQEYLRIQDTLAHNRNQLGEAVRGSARQGKGLLAGLVRCGRCGRKMRGRYGGRHARTSAVVYYQCYASQTEEIGKQICSLFGGVTVEQAVTTALLDVFAPIRMEALISARDRVATKRTEKRKHRELQLERARYEADRYQRQYDAVEPENRIVARTLESRWNSALEKVCQLEHDLSQEERSHESMSVEEEEQLRTLALDLPGLWDHPDASFDLKKRILRAVIKEIVVYVEKKTLRVLVHWQGGQHTEMILRKRKVGEHRWKTCQDTLDLIQHLARVYRVT